MLHTTRLFALLVVTASAFVASGCATVANPTMQSLGRGANPLDKGDIRVFGSAGAGAGFVAVAGGGIGVEAQATESLAFGATVGGVGQLDYLDGGWPEGIAGHGQAHVQYNPGLQWLALRGRFGLGYEANSGIEGFNQSSSAFDAVTAAGSVEGVLSLPEPLIDGLDLWLSAGLGHRRLFPITVNPPSLTAGYVSGVTSLDLEIGVAYSITDNISVFGAGKGLAAAAGLQPYLGAGAQVGAAFKF